jgi:hypothetical protein
MLDAQNAAAQAAAAQADDLASRARATAEQAATKLEDAINAAKEAQVAQAAAAASQSAEQAAAAASRDQAIISGINALQGSGGGGGSVTVNAPDTRPNIDAAAAAANANAAAANANAAAAQLAENNRHADLLDQLNGSAVQAHNDATAIKNSLNAISDPGTTPGDPDTSVMDMSKVGQNKAKGESKLSGLTGSIDPSSQGDYTTKFPVPWFGGTRYYSLSIVPESGSAVDQLRIIVRIFLVFAFAMAFMVAIVHTLRYY